MKYMLLAFMVSFFVVTPLYLLNKVVMPQLLQLETSYASAATTADNLTANR